MDEKIYSEMVYNWGHADGMAAGKHIVNGDIVNHGDLLITTNIDPYVIGYRKGFIKYRTDYYDRLSRGVVILPNGEVDHGYQSDVFRYDNYQHPESMEYQNTYYDGN